MAVELNFDTIFLSFRSWNRITSSRPGRAPNDFATFSRNISLNRRTPKNLREIDSRPPSLQRNPSHRREIDRHLYHERKLLKLTEKYVKLNHVRPYNEDLQVPDRRKIDRHLYRNFSSNRRTHNSEVHPTVGVNVLGPPLQAWRTWRRCLRYIIFREDLL